MTPCDLHRVDTLKKQHRVLIHCKTRHSFSQNEAKHAQFRADTLPTPWKIEPQGVTERGSFFKFLNASIPLIMTKYICHFFPLLLKKDRNLPVHSCIIHHYRVLWCSHPLLHFIITFCQYPGLNRGTCLKGQGLYPLG